jgi:hypothetical protein
MRFGTNILLSYSFLRCRSGWIGFTDDARQAVKAGKQYPGFRRI